MKEMKERPLNLTAFNLDAALEENAEVYTRNGYRAEIIKSSMKGEFCVIAEVSSPEPIVVANRLDGTFESANGEAHDLDLMLRVFDSASEIPSRHEGRYGVKAVKTPLAPLALQVGGNHYKAMAIQPVEYCHKNNLSSLASSVVRYVSRHEQKNGKEDLLKAKHCLDLLIEFDYEQEKPS